MGGWVDGYAGRQADRSIDRWVDGWMDMHGGRQTDRYSCQLCDIFVISWWVGGWICRQAGRQVITMAHLTIDFTKNKVPVTVNYHRYHS